MQFSLGRRSPQLTLCSVCWMQQLVSSQTLTSTTVACRVYFTTSCTGLTSPSESSTSLLLWFAGVWKTLRRIWSSDYCIPVTTVSTQQPTPTFSQPASTDYTALSAAIGLSLLQARWSGTHYWLSFAICLSVLVFFGAHLRRYYSHDISASSAIEMYPRYCAI